MTLLDWLIVLALLAGVGFSFYLVGQKKAGNQVIVEQDGKVLFSAPLGSDREETFTGPVGETVMAIRNREVFISQSDCPRKICMGMGHIHRNGEVIACVPNHILVRVAGEEKEDEREYDILSR
jgi:hypothetical protein